MSDVITTSWQLSEDPCGECGKVAEDNAVVVESNNPQFPQGTVWCENDRFAILRAAVLPSIPQPTLQELMDQIASMQGAVDQLVLDSLLG